MSSIGRLINRINASLALKITLGFGTVWCFYVTVAYSFLPVWFPNHTEMILFVSNAVQLAALPILMVGTNLLATSSERRSIETHDAVMEEFRIAKEGRAMIHGMFVVSMKQHAQILAKLDSKGGGNERN